MAEQISHDVVNQTRSGGESSSSDVPVGNLDKNSAEGDVGRITYNQLDTRGESSSVEQSLDDKRTMDINDVEKFAGGENGDVGRQGPNSVATRALELNGVASLSDGGEDGGSLGGSDTDTSRTDSRHARTGSVKKPTAFKPVSFAKFSVPKAPGSSTTPKPGEKPILSAAQTTVSPQPTSRPRLVAKTTSGLGLTSKPTASGLKVTSSGPDPSQVWNKNRPAQPPPTKHLTDEELKQQYGIHMTSRIQEDGNGTEAKWADIDDDEDDWAPETIEWNDGTKIQLTHTENIPPPGQDAAPYDKGKELSRPPETLSTRESARMLLSKPSTTVGPNATVLRLGANAERQQQQAKAAIASRSGADKQILTSKSLAPVPSKSPWAPLPPVDKIYPVNPPVQTIENQYVSRVPTRDQSAQDNSTVPIHTREIAADDFNRSWRDEQLNAPRELYNSHSGRYEPVPENRKGSIRHDSHMRPPAVLQRPGGNEFGGPAEPSAAFQTHRTSHQEVGHWPRRRASSNVSGGSGSYGRRMSFGRPDGPVKSHETRRGSQVNGSFENAISPTEAPHIKDMGPQDRSPSQHSVATSWQSRAPNNAAYAPPNSHSGVSQLPENAPTPEVPQDSSEDVISMQQRIMKEKRMEARQRRIEQEQKEEAERRERIRLKLQALGPAPEKEKLKAEEQSVKTSPKDSTSLPNTHPIIQSPPKPPVPEPTGEPQQYGMMKVHPPEPVKKIIPSNERIPKKPLETSVPNRRAVSPAREMKAEPAQPNGISQSEESYQSQKQTQNIESSVSEERDSQWRGNINSNTYSPWSSGAKLSNHPSPSSNPWKPLSSDKTLGNGTFDRNLASFSPRELSLRGPVGLAEPTSIGPLSGNMDKINGSQPFPGPRLGQDSQPPLASLTQTDKRHPQYEPFHAIARPRPIGPPNTQPPQWHSETRRSVQPATTAWNNFHAVAAKQEVEDQQKFQRELETIRDEPAASLNVNFSETWRQVRPGDVAGQRQVVSVVKSNEPSGPLQTLHGFDTPMDGLPFTEAQSRPFSNVTGRSRFFPTMTDTSKSTFAVDDGRPLSPSPPPPEEHSSHPAYGGSTHRPLVNLPIPKPVVKLPPKAIAPPPNPPTFASMAAVQPRLPHHSLVATSWQDRINGLLGKSAVSEKRNTLAVASATREPLDVQSHPSSAAVSLPQVKEVDIRDAGRVTTKEVEDEEAIFEDREAGSLPVVRVPIMAPPNAWQALPAHPRLRPKVLKPMQVHTIEPYCLDLPEKDGSGSWQILIHIPGSSNVISVPFSKKLGVPSQRQKGTSNFRSRKHPRPRDVSVKSNVAQGGKRQTSSANTTKENATPSRSSHN
ncbi:hypothetical protein BGW36DRAFT_297832 [Talaromyces proteolyticus]|uniref:Uncharacterized protein n=1 Tax=Talaromyces proteolyticus TaxID=1131652 RepID=A0AAD4KNZ8_9EURO|nr:uncharacterized protein BGW36DRAFT_297832 [Talaromyces proteolyticus]KAH8696100.1 hypothetical protein BGW36DRAFT_297832 [Talaromyces proteolyticus]